MKKPGISVILSLAFSCLAALAVGLTLFALEHFARKAVERDAGQALQYFARHITNELDQEIFRNVDSLRAYAYLLSQSNDANRRIDHYHHARPVFEWLGFVGADGEIKSATRGELLGLNVARDPAFQASARGIYVSRARQLEGDLAGSSLTRTAPMALEMGVPVLKGNQLQGVLAARLSFDWFSQILKDKLQPALAERGIEVLVVDQQGRVLLSPPGVFVAVPKSMQEGLPRMLRWEDGDYLSALAGSHGYRDYTGLGWRVFVRQPEALAVQELTRNRMKILQLGGLVIIACGFLGWRLARRISRPLRELTQAAESMHQHQSARLPNRHTYRETETLSKTLALLLSSLLGEKRKLSDLNDSLEQQVLTRTRMLEQANEHLLDALAERHTLISQLETLARTDSLTSLPNRRAFFERAELEIHRVERHGGSLCLIAVDIDFFKKINDRYGHEGGDQVLRSFGKTVVQLLRDVDLIARLGGEEFVALLPDTGQSAARIVAERLCHGLAGVRTPYQDDEIRFTVSLGIAEFAAGETLKHWLARADTALYEAKRSGRNRVVVWSRELESKAAE